MPRDDLGDATYSRSSNRAGMAVMVPYVQSLCAPHHSVKEHPDNPDLQFLQVTDVRASRPKE
ncbi:MAG: hypothetical protein ACE5R6_00830 [Candidatus Heimdallarchaeota archaeon]